jgi:hypothetical protein
MSTELKTKSETKIHYTQQWVNLVVYKSMLACSRSRPDLDVKVKELQIDEQYHMVKVQLIFSGVSKNKYIERLVQFCILSMSDYLVTRSESL